MKKYVQILVTKLSPFLAVAQKYSRFMYFVFLMLLCGFLIYQINQFANVTPSETDVTDKLKTITRPHIDQKAVTQIQNLQDQNVNVDTMFKNARDNPFSE